MSKSGMVLLLLGTVLTITGVIANITKQRPAQPESTEVAGAAPSPGPEIVRPIRVSLDVDDTRLRCPPGSHAVWLPPVMGQTMPPKCLADGFSFTPAPMPCLPGH